jgi:AcrR family transcriptional regulator
VSVFCSNDSGELSASLKPMSLTPSPSPRSDAQRNRARILDAAAHAWAADPGASLNTIAKRAQVGAGTLYRHFPTRVDIFLALYRHEIENLSATVNDLLATQPPTQALRAWFLRLADLIHIKHGLGEALNTAAARDVIDATYAPVLGAIRRLLDAGEQAGELRRGLDESDVLLLMSCVWRVPANAAGQAQADRLLDTVIDALRPRS